MKSSKESRKKRKKLEDVSDLLSLSLGEPRQTLAELTPFQVILSQSMLFNPQQKLILHQTSPQSPFQITPSVNSVFVPPSPSTNPLNVTASSSSRSVRKSDTIPPPFPWATNHRATVHSLEYLVQNQIFTVTGEVQCKRKRCEHKSQIEFDLREKFTEVWNFIAENKSTMHDRAPSVWMKPTMPNCNHCGQQNSVTPVIAEKKRSINWLFLLLGQMLGFCTLQQLKYFCEHTNNHKTAAKDRVLYLTYLELCRQLDPDGPFDL